MVDNLGTSHAIILTIERARLQPLARVRHMHMLPTKIIAAPRCFWLLWLMVECVVPHLAEAHGGDGGDVDADVDGEAVGEARARSVLRPVGRVRRRCSEHLRHGEGERNNMVSKKVKNIARMAER